MKARLLEVVAKLRLHRFPRSFELAFAILPVALLIFMAIFFAASLLPVFAQPKKEKYLNLGDVRGMAVESNGLLYTLNFEQQTEAVKWLNLSTPVADKQFVQSFQLPKYSKIVIYVFNGPQIQIIPVGYDDDNLLFEAKAWEKEGWLKDISKGKLKEILEQTYD